MLTRWRRKVRRRKPGIYAYRTRRHARAGAEWGYVGKSNRLDLRDGQHAERAAWYDLVLRRYIVIRLPWWLGWDWVLLPLETLVIALLLPRYNVQKNPRPFGKVGIADQLRQRANRNMLGNGYKVRTALANAWTIAYRTAGALVLLAGVGGYLWTR